MSLHSKTFLQVLVAILSGALWVPYLGSFPITLLLATVATFILSLIITKMGPVRCTYLRFTHQLYMVHVLGTSSVFQRQKDHLFQGNSAMVFCLASSLASLHFRSGCQSICSSLSTIAKVLPQLYLVMFWEANGLGIDECVFLLRNVIFLFQYFIFNLFFSQNYSFPNIISKHSP